MEYGLFSTTGGDSFGAFYAMLLDLQELTKRLGQRRQCLPWLVWPGPVQATDSTELMLCDSPSSQLRLVTGNGAESPSSARTQFKEVRLTDLNLSQSSLDAGTAVD